MDFSALDFKKVTDFARRGLDKARQYAEGLNELEIKVEEATNSDRWGPHGTLMQEITKRSFNMEEYKQILGILARRLHSEPSTWRQVYKSLLLLEYMSKNGPQRIIPELKSNGRVFTRLQKFEFVDEDGKDQGLNVRNRAKELWNLVHDDSLIASEREKAAANRKKFGGFDQSSSLFQSMPNSSSDSSSAAAFTTDPPRRNGGANSSSSTPGDAVVATEERLANLGLTDDDATPASGGRVPPPKQTKQKLKLSQISADNSIAGSIAAIAAKAPAPAPKPAAVAVGDGGMNLLDFGDDEVAAASAPASSDPMALLDQLADPVAAPTAAAGGDDDWADFTSTEPATGGSAGVGGAGAGQGDWAPFAGAAQPQAGDQGDAWADFASAPAGGAPGASSADPFGTSAGASAPAPGAPSGLAGAVPTARGRQALPLDAFAAPVVEPIPVATSAAVGNHPEASASVATPVTPAKKVAEKDPFADLLG